MSKMPLKEYNLRCKDHTDTLVSVFEDLNRNTLVDCTLAAEGQYLEAHKVVLSACSSYFKLLFSEESEKNPIVILVDVAFQDLKAAVNFMYRGEVNICEDRLNDFLELATSLQIAGLQNFGRTQCSPDKSLTVEIQNPKSAATEWQQSRNEAGGSHSDTTISSSNVPADCERVKNNENFSICRSPVSSPSVSSLLPQVSSRENEQSDVNPVINTELVIDRYGQEKSKEADMDLEDDLMIKEEQEVWDEYNVNMSDEQSVNRRDLDFTSELMKNEEGSSENTESVQTENHPSLEDFTTELVMSEEGITENAEEVQSEHHPSLEDATSNQQDNAQNSSSMLMTEKPSPSSSRSNQEFYGGGERDQSAETPDAPTGSEYVVDRGIRCNQLSQHTTQFNHTKTAITSSNITSISAKTLSSLQPKEGLQREAGKHIDLQCQNGSSSSLKMKKHTPLLDKSEDQKCSMCNYTAKCSSFMIRHLRSHNLSGGRPYVCSHCTYKAMSKFSFKKHIRIHGEEKPYQCPECDYRAKFLSTLLQHQQKHSNEKPYQCPECDFNTNRSSSLMRHRLRHSNEKPYQCPECDYKTNRCFSLMQHRQRHSN